MILNKAFDYKPLYVIHLAALFANQNSIDNPINDLKTNGFGFIKILEYCKKFNVKKVLYSSSSCVYGNKIIMNENDVDLNPDTPYAITKLLGEHMQNFGHLIMDLMLSLKCLMFMTWRFSRCL